MNYDYFQTKWDDYATGIQLDIYKRMLGRELENAQQKYISREEFEARMYNMLEKIYDVIKEHSYIDITREEFMELIDE